MTAISKMDLITHISCSSGIDKKTVRKVFNSSLESIKSILQTGQEIRLMDFGSFLPQQSKERRSFNPQKREMMMVPATMRVRFKASQDLKNLLNKEGSPPKAKLAKIDKQAKAESVKTEKPEKRKTLTLKHQSKTA